MVRICAKAGAAINTDRLNGRHGILIAHKALLSTALALPSIWVRFTGLLLPPLGAERPDMLQEIRGLAWPRVSAKLREGARRGEIERKKKTSRRPWNRRGDHGRENAVHRHNRTCSALIGGPRTAGRRSRPRSDAQEAPGF